MRLPPDYRELNFPLARRTGQALGQRDPENAAAIEGDDEILNGEPD
jgi:hypothetical protein